MAPQPRGSSRTDNITPKAAGIVRGDKGDEVERLQRYLERFGYFDSGVHAQFGMRPMDVGPPPAKRGEFEERTETALRKFQSVNHLTVSGRLDEATLALMQRKRCGCPDNGLIVRRSGALGEFVAQGNKWSSMALRFGFVEFTPDLTEAQVRSAITTALGYWSAVTPLTFAEIPNASNPEIRIRFVGGDHGDGSPFDAGGGVLAHAFYPPPNGGDIAGDTHFDEAETWSTNLPPTGIDLITVAAHEFGHALGLAHSTVSDALMYPYYGGPHRFLHQDDIDGIQSIYGSQQWLHSKLIQLCFATYHSRNAWAYVEDAGWRKIRPQTTDGTTNMFAGACEARCNNVRTSVLVVNNEIEQMYV